MGNLRRETHNPAPPKSRWWWNKCASRPPGGALLADHRMTVAAVRCHPGARSLSCDFNLFFLAPARHVACTVQSLELTSCARDGSFSRSVRSCLSVAKSYRHDPTWPFSQFFIKLTTLWAAKNRLLLANRANIFLIAARLNGVSGLSGAPRECTESTMAQPIKGVGRFAALSSARRRESRWPNQ